MKKGVRKMLAKAPAACLLAFILLSACRTPAETPSLHIKEDMDFSFIKRVAVLPFRNLSAYEGGDEIIRSYVSNELLASGLVDVVVPGDVFTGLSQTGVKNITSLSAGEIQAVGKALKVQAVVFGTIEVWREIQSGTVGVPEITLTIIMADTSSGNIIWSVTRMEGGGNFSSRHLGFQSDTMSKVGLRAVKNAVRTLSEY